MNTIEKLVQFLKPRDDAEALTFRRLLSDLFAKPGASRAKDELGVGDPDFPPELLEAMVGASRERAFVPVNKSLAATYKATVLSDRLARVEKRARKVNAALDAIITPAPKQATNGAAHPLAGMLGAPYQPPMDTDFSLLTRDVFTDTEPPETVDDVLALLADLEKRIEALEEMVGERENLAKTLAKMSPANSPLADWR